MERRRTQRGCIRRCVPYSLAPVWSEQYELPLLSSLLPTHPVCHSYPGPKRILKHLDLDIGSAETTTQNIWTHDWATKCMVVRDVKYVPGFIKIVDEILFNAANNKVSLTSLHLSECSISLRVRGEASQSAYMLSVLHTTSM